MTPASHDRPVGSQIDEAWRRIEAVLRRHRHRVTTRPITVLVADEELTCSPR
jgi:hypothetical protein